MVETHPTTPQEDQVAEVDACCTLLDQIGQLAREQAGGRVKLPPETLVHAFSLGGALLDRVEQLLTPAPAPPGPAPTPPTPAA